MFGLVGLGIGLVSVVLTFIFYRRGRRYKRLSWAIRSNNLISGYATRYPDLAIAFRDHKVENLTVSKVLLWNGGTETIDNSDIASAALLRIVGVGGTKLLDAKTLQVNSGPSRFDIRLTEDDCSALFTFDFLDRNEGGVIKVIHTGRSSSDIRVVGTIKGAGAPQPRPIKITSASLPLPSWMSAKMRPSTRRKIRSIVAGVWTAQLAIGSCVFSLHWGFTRGDLVLSAVGGVLTAMLAFLVFAVASEIRALEVPPGLEAFEENM